MMDATVPFKIVNAPQLKAELDAASGGAYQGYSVGSKWLGMARLHFADNTKQPAIDATINAYEAHDPAVLTTDQTLAARRLAAAGDLAAADFVAVLNQINAATSLADAKPILKKLLALTYRVALAQGLTDATDPGA
jgi:hypothetical protein